LAADVKRERKRDDRKTRLSSKVVLRNASRAQNRQINGLGDS